MSRDDWETDGSKNDNAEHAEPAGDNGKIPDNTPLELRIKALETRLQILQDKEKRRLEQLEGTTEWLIRTKPKFDWRPILVAVASTAGMMGFFWYYIFVHKGLH